VQPWPLIELQCRIGCTERCVTSDEPMPQRCSTRGLTRPALYLDSHMSIHLRPGKQGSERIPPESTLCSPRTLLRKPLYEDTEPAFSWVREAHQGSALLTGAGYSAVVRHAPTSPYTGLTGVRQERVCKPRFSEKPQPDAPTALAVVLRQLSPRVSKNRDSFDLVAEHVLGLLDLGQCLRCFQRLLNSGSGLKLVTNKSRSCTQRAPVVTKGNSTSTQQASIRSGCTPFAQSASHGYAPVRSGTSTVEEGSLRRSRMLRVVSEFPAALAYGVFAQTVSETARFRSCRVI
jgi:hypothetical protein